MSDTMWFNRKPGDFASESTDDELPAILVGDQTPDWVRMPPELGGQQVRVTGTRQDPCPCQGHNVKHYDLMNGISVAECPMRGFLWYRKRA